MAENDLIVGFCEGLDTRGKRERDIIRSFPSPVFIRIDDPQPGDVEWAKLVLQYYLTPEAENYKPRPNMKFVHFDEKGQMEG